MATSAGSGATRLAVQPRHRQVGVGELRAPSEAYLDRFTAAASAVSVVSTSTKDRLDAVNCAGHFSTSSYSRNSVGVVSGITQRSATIPRIRLDALSRLRKAEITTELLNAMHLTGSR